MREQNYNETIISCGNSEIEVGRVKTGPHPCAENDVTLLNAPRKWEDEPPLHNDKELPDYKLPKDSQNEVPISERKIPLLWRIAGMIYPIVMIGIGIDFVISFPEIGWVSVFEFTPAMITLTLCIIAFMTAKKEESSTKARKILQSRGLFICFLVIDKIVIMVSGLAVLCLHLVASLRKVN